MSECSAVEEQPTKPKQMNPKFLRQTIYWLALDWINLHDHLPAPASPGGPKRTSNVKEYGHPAEWASDTARDIVDKLSGWHDYLAEHRNERRPLIGVAFGTSESSKTQPFKSRVESVQAEHRRLVAAWRYLEPRCEQLVELVDKDALKELPDLHHTIRKVLGQYVPKYTIPVPCPNDECGLRTLMRTMGIGQDFIVCDACGYAIKDTYYPLLVKMTLDAFLTDAQNSNCTDTVDATDTTVSASPNPQRRHHRHWGFFAC